MDVILAIMESPVLKVPISDHNNYTFFSTFFAYPLSLQLHYPKKENIIFIYSIPLYSSSDCYYYFLAYFLCVGITISSLRLHLIITLASQALCY